jgi:N utilization substance protein B
MQVPEIHNRRDARRTALQVIYAVELSERDPEQVFDDLVQGGQERQVAFARELVRTTARHRGKLDEQIAAKSHRWDLNRMALLDRLLLRMALAELFYLEDVPPKVTINEAIEISKEFSTDQSGRFINGMLDAIFLENEQEIRRRKRGGATS